MGPSGTADRFEPHQFENQIRGAVQDPEEREENEVKNPERNSNQEANLLRRPDGDRFWHQLTEDDVHPRDDGKGHRKGDRMNRLGRHRKIERGQNVEKEFGKRRFSDPSQAKRSECNSQLGGRKVGVEAVDHPLRNPRDRVPPPNEDFQAGRTDLDQRKLRRHEEGIHPDKEKGQEEVKDLRFQQRLIPVHGISIKLKAESEKGKGWGKNQNKKLTDSFLSVFRFTLLSLSEGGSCRR